MSRQQQPPTPGTPGTSNDIGTSMTHSMAGSMYGPNPADAQRQPQPGFWGQMHPSLGAHVAPDPFGAIPRPAGGQDLGGFNPQQGSMRRAIGR